MKTPEQIALDAADKIRKDIGFYHEGIKQIILAAIREANKDLQAEVDQLREENTQLQVNFSEAIEELQAHSDFAGVLHRTQKHNDRLALLVRLLQGGRIRFGDLSGTIESKEGYWPRDVFKWTEEQWERLAELERGGM